MNAADISPYTPSEKRLLLSAAREAGKITYDDLDRLLPEACASGAKMTALLRALKDVLVVDSPDPQDVLNESIEPVIDGARDDYDFYRLYANQVRSLRRLTRAEEHMLARRLEFARERLRGVAAAAGLSDEALQQVVEHGLNCDTLRDALRGLDIQDSEKILERLPCEDRDPLLDNIVHEYDRIRGHFVERNLYLVIGMSVAYRTYGLPVMDLIQEGNASLIRAVEKFDWRKDVRFQTYAAFWIRQAIERLITANRGIVRVPNYIQQKMRRLRREGKLPRNQRDMDVRDVSNHFATTAEGAARLMETDRSWFSLDVPMGENEGSFAATLAAEETDQGMSAAERRALGERLDQVMERALTEQEREIIAMRFGLGGQERRTLDQIGEQMSVSRERIRQMQVKALDKLSKRQLLEELEGFL